MCKAVFLRRRLELCCVTLREQRCSRCRTCSEAAGLGRGRCCWSRRTGPAPAPFLAAYLGALPASRFPSWSSAEHGHAGAARSRGALSTQGAVKGGGQTTSSPCSPVRHPGPVLGPRWGKNLSIHARPASLRSRVTRRRGPACTGLGQGSAAWRVRVHSREPHHRRESR